MYFYEGCKDPPERLTGDCYPKRMNRLRDMTRTKGDRRKPNLKAEKRKALGLTQVQLGKLLGVSTGLIADFETGYYKGNYPRKTWDKLCSVYGSSLLEGYHKPAPKQSTIDRRRYPDSRKAGK